MTTDEKPKSKARFKKVFDGNVNPFDREPDWSDMEAVLAHYGHPKPVDWLHRQMSEGLVVKGSARPWGKLTPKQRCQACNYLHEMIYQLARTGGYDGPVFRQQKEYND